MTTKNSLRKQIIVPIGNDNKTKFIVSSSAYIININSALKNIKSDIRADLVRIDQHSIIMMMNNIASTSDLQMVKNYVKNANHLDSKNMKILYIP